MSAKDFDKYLAIAVSQCFYQSTPPNEKQEALRYLEMIKSSQDGWKFCLMYFFNNQDSQPEAKFFSLQVVEDALRNKYNLFSEEEKQTIKTGLLNWYREQLPQRANEPPYIRNKFAHIIVLLFINEFLKSWGSFFSDLALNLSSQIHVDMFLRICLTIDEEIVSRLIQRNEQEANTSTNIKDKMREVAIVDLVNMWYNILVMYHSVAPEIVNSCLRVISLYVDWIDINLIVSEKFLTAFFNFLQREEYIDSACECVNEIVLKGMNAEKKITLIQSINLGQVLKLVESRGEDGYSEQVLKLVNSVGVTLSECWVEFDKDERKREQDVCYQMINSILPFFFKLFVSQEEEVACSVVDFSQSLIGIFRIAKKKGELNLEKKTALQNLLSAIVIQMKHLDTNFSDGDFEEIRKRLKVQFESVTSIDEEMMSEYVLAAFTVTMNNLDKCPFSDVALSLKLLFLFGDSIKGQIKFGKVGKPLEVCLSQMMRLMMEKCNMFNHPSVQLEYFENVVRYARFFEVFTEYLDSALISFLDWRGLHHNDSSVRNRVMYLFFRFVKSLRIKLVGQIESILVSIQDLLVLPDSNLTIIRPRRRRLSQNSISGESLEEFNDQLYLFETVGILISVESIPDDKKVQYLTSVINPLMLKIDEIMAKQLYKFDTEDNPVYCTILHHAITAIATIAKGFPGYSGKPTAWEPVLKMSMEKTTFVLRSIPNSQLVKDATRFSFQRLVGCLGQEILPYLPSTVSLLLPNSQLRDLTDFIPLISQLTFRFKDTIFPTLNQFLGDLLNQIFTAFREAVAQPKDEINTFESIQLIELKKAYLSMILAIFMSGLSGVFVTQENIRYIQIIFESLIQFIRVDDSQIQKPALGLLTKMIDTWASQGQEILVGFNQFARSQIFPLTLEILSKPTFNISDGQSLVVLGEVVNVQKSMYQKMQNDLVEYLIKIYFPSIGFSSVVAQEYVIQLQQSDPKAFKKFLMGLLKKT